MTTQNHRVWINNGKIEIDNGEILSIVSGVCLEKGCSIELVAGSVTSMHPMIVTVAPEQTILPRHVEGVLLHGVIKIPNTAGRLSSNMFREVPVRDGAIVRIFIQGRK
ncbi:hypothetical protein BH11CYA1_BH11CYA1_31070 [soil metagenome]